VNTVAAVPHLGDYTGFVLRTALGLALLAAPAIVVFFTVWFSVRALSAV
jgi:hypothetical protein